MVQLGGTRGRLVTVEICNMIDASFDRPGVAHGVVEKVGGCRRESVKSVSQRLVRSGHPSRLGTVGM